ncbi:MAG: hypothetical protein GY874_15355 [Desulfobacteraceae bacterium]|nr:hypothetical protein [Desulfobacteraceae bacterium]
MINIKNKLMEAAGPLKGSAEFKGLMLKTARIRHGAGTKPADLLGWDVVAKNTDGSCYAFYGAQEPLTGMSGPEPVLCPLGVVAFDKYKINFREALAIAGSLNCGSTFVAISLSRPLTPKTGEPLWHIRMSNGNDIVIGAATGEAHCCPPTAIL